MRDYRLKFVSYGEVSFLQQIKENKEILDYFMSLHSTGSKK